MPEVESHSYVAQVKAQLLKFHRPPTEQPIPVWEWQKAFSALFEYIHSLEDRIVNLENATLETAMKVKDQKPFIAMKDWNKTDLTDSKYDPE